MSNTPKQSECSTCACGRPAVQEELARYARIGWDWSRLPSVLLMSPSFRPSPAMACILVEVGRSRRLVDPTLSPHLGLLAAFLLVPLAPSFSVIDLALEIALFSTLVASYDVVIGDTASSRSVTPGFGAYAVALARGRPGAPSYGHLSRGFAAGIVVWAAVAVVIGAFFLRVKPIFFAAIALAFAAFTLIPVVQ